MTDDEQHTAENDAPWCCAACRAEGWRCAASCGRPCCVPSAENEAPHCSTCSCASVGYVQQARWGEWQAVCTAPRCGWHASRGNQTRQDAEKMMRGHAALCHPPRIPVRPIPPAETAAQEGEGR